MTTNKKSNKRLIVIFIAVFCLPVVLAKLALDNQWFNQAVTNKGELLQPSLDMQKLATSQAKPKWKLLYVLPDNCEASCKNALYSLAQVWTALGKEQDRVESVVITMTQSDKGVLQTDLESKHIKVVEADRQVVSQVFKEVKTNGIFIADTMNNIILRYPIYEDAQQAVLYSRDILADLRKVLKLSRIG